MIDPREPEIVLQGLFLYLNKKGFRLGVRDFKDAVKALRVGFGLRSRTDLLWLCETLWARTDEEKRVLNLLFAHFPFPTPDELEKYSLIKKQQSEVKEAASSQMSKKYDVRELQDSDNSEEAQSYPTTMQFSPTNEAGLDVPRASVQPLFEEAYIFTTLPPVRSRELAIVWRRYRETSRVGPKVEIDIEATIAEKCRKGIIEKATLVPARRNLAKVTALVDVSSSMIPWEIFIGVLVESLKSISNQSVRSKVYFFNNVPLDVFYQRSNLTEPVTIGEAVQFENSSTLFIFSDAGSARGYLREDRIRDTEQFIRKTIRYWRPVVWINPMPKKRWLGSSAEEISKLQHITMLELGEEQLINAVDILRGQK